MIDKEEIESFIEDMTKVRPEMLNKEAYKLFQTIMKILDERDMLIKERDYYKERYNKFNNAQGLRTDLKRVDTVVDRLETKKQTIERLGFNQKQNAFIKGGEKLIED